MSRYISIKSREKEFIGAEMAIPRRYRNVPRLDKCSVNQSNKWNDYICP